MSIEFEHALDTVHEDTYLLPPFDEASEPTESQTGRILSSMRNSGSYVPEHLPGIGLTVIEEIETDLEHLPSDPDVFVVPRSVLESIVHRATRRSAAFTASSINKGLQGLQLFEHPDNAA
jgi:hypothetical protein